MRSSSGGRRGVADSVASGVHRRRLASTNATSTATATAAAAAAPGFGRPDSSVTFGDSVWWGATTITTVGYGDRFPVTAEGRLVAVGLMVAGIALLGVVTASLASWFVERVGEVQAAEEQTQRDLDRVLAEIRQLREDLGRSSRPPLDVVDLERHLLTQCALRYL